MSNLSKAGHRAALFLALSVAGCGNDESNALDPTLASINDGQLEGDVLGNTVRFLKIPYAKPPVGELRWKAPEPNDPWSGVRHEAAFASPCPQPPSQQSPASADEDCLYLNVWRPNRSVDRAPVMVWIHGGGFTTGSAADVRPAHDRSSLVRRPALCRARRRVVSTQLSTRGVRFLRASGARRGRLPVGNQGLLDQRQLYAGFRTTSRLRRRPGQCHYLRRVGRARARCVCTWYRPAVAGCFIVRSARAAAAPPATP